MVVAAPIAPRQTTPVSRSRERQRFRQSNHHACLRRKTRMDFPSTESLSLRRARHSEESAIVLLTMRANRSPESINSIL
jgi:hypothetical protein